MPAPQEAPVTATPAIAVKPDFPELGAALPAGHTAYDNASLARLFVVLTHEMEGGARRPHLVRYEVPVSVGVEGPEGARYGAFLDGFLALLRRKSGIAIGRGPGPYNLHVRFVDGEQFNATLPTAFCVIAGGDLSWEVFAADPSGANARQTANASRLEHNTIFIPDNARPHLARNCLLEEVPQALGMSNDLFGLGTSSFNDDGAHLWPTKLDYLMLRVLYAPEMTTGLDRRETRDRALVILNRINPAGLSAPPLPMLRQRSLEVWSHLIGRVFSRDASKREVREDVGKALQVVEAYAPMSAQHCHTLVTAGRVLSRPEPERALQLLDLARRVCDTAHGVSDIRHARIKLQQACALSRLGRYGEAIALTGAIWPVLAAHGQDRPLAALYTIQADALEASEPGSPRTRSVGQLAAAWNAYAMGPGQRAASCRRKG
ncbi:MAG: DUF2927 domain-containing protein [Alphaproteobacteria bacterium]